MVFTHLQKRCEWCANPIPDYPYQNAYTVRACSCECAGRLYRQEHPVSPIWGGRVPGDDEPTEKPSGVFGIVRADGDEANRKVS